MTKAVTFAYYHLQNPEPASLCAMLVPLYFLPMLSSLSRDMCKQVMSRQHSMQDDSNSINVYVHVVLYALLDYYLHSIVIARVSYRRC